MSALRRLDRISKMCSKSARIVPYECYQCRNAFTVKVRTVFESSCEPLRLWLQAVHLLASSKKIIFSNKLHRALGVTLKTAWFMSHRLKQARRTIGIEPLGGAGAIVDADEAFIGLVLGEGGKEAACAR